MVIQRRGPILVLILISIFIFLSCESGKDPVYAGSWRSVSRVETGDIVYRTIRTLTLTRSTYEETYEIQRENSGQTVGIFGLKGKIAFSRYYMIFRLEELGSCVRDESDACTRTVQWFGEGSKYWNDNIPYFQRTVRGEFEAGETRLHLRRDLNNDNDTDDLGEDIEFERI